MLVHDPSWYPCSGNVDAVMFARFQSAEPTASGRHPGVFALANGLAADGFLTPEEHSWWRENNAWFELAHADPGRAHPEIFDRATNAYTACWFKVGSADHLIERLDGYLRLLDKYGISWERLMSDDPGRILYEDDFQVVVDISG